MFVVFKLPSSQIVTVPYVPEVTSIGSKELGTTRVFRIKCVCHLSFFVA